MQGPGQPDQTPFEGPFEAMSNAFGPDADFGLFNRFHYTPAQLVEFFMDDLGKMLNQLEKIIENSQPTPLEPGMPDMYMESFGDPGSGLSAPPHDGQDVSSGQVTIDWPPLPYYIEAAKQPPPLHKPPHHPADRVGRSGGRDFGSANPEQNDGTYCPVEQDYVSRDLCEDRDCEYYEKDSGQGTDWRCTYDSEHES